MSVELGLTESVGLFVAGLLGALMMLRLLLRWRYALALSRARRIAARLRTPAKTLAEVEEQSAAVQELVEFPEPRAAAAAARELLGTTDAPVRSAAVEILRGLRALDIWSRDLQRGSYKTKLRAIEALGEVGDEQAVEELLEALGDDDPDVARAASHAVVAHDPDHASDRLAEALTSPNRRLAETAAATLVRMGEDAVEALMSQLASPSAQARRLAAESLGSVGERAVMQGLLTRLEAEPMPEVRAAVAEAMARIDAEGAGQQLRQLARGDTDWFVRARAYALLAEANAPGAKEFLVEGLSEIGTDLEQFSDAGDEVESIAEGPQRIRSAIITGLRLLGLNEEQIAADVGQVRDAQLSGEETKAISELLAMLRDRDPVRRAEAARQLGEAGESHAESLKQVLRDPEPLVRAEAARALGMTESQNCLDALAACLQDPDANVRLAAMAAIRAVVTREATREAPE
jgi:HEAT repeat protein